VLELAEAVVDRAPAGGDEVDENCEIVHARVPLGGEIDLEVLEPPQDLRLQAANLGKLASDRQRLGPKAVANRLANPGRERRLQLGRRLGKRLQLPAGALERGARLRRVGALADAAEPLGRPLNRVHTHGVQRYFADRMETSELDYDLPTELIAQRPVERRDQSRLLVFDRSTGAVRHRRFAELPAELSGELVVVNDTRVVPARLRLRRPTGGEAEVLLLERTGEDGVWEALARPSRRLRPGQRLDAVELLEPLGEGRWRVRLTGEPAGEMPLPPYIHERLEDPERYQTVYAREPGSAAAPTAGLHLTPELLARLELERVTLHVGLDTFRPVTERSLEEHRLHGERYAVSPEAWKRIRTAGRVLAVGTTTVRVVETLARGGALSGRTELFVTPGFEFRRVDALLTNFHLPRSTLLALVMAFAGVEETRRLYRTAIAERYRFYSFGDAMLIL
jgi:S-adenosylmethionine:tRNA ribosyltransferase-isomerase